MARSSYIYLVYSVDDNDVHAAFTVKWEAIAWIEKQGDASGSYYLIRTPDGCGYDPKEVDIG